MYGTRNRHPLTRVGNKHEVQPHMHYSFILRHLIKYQC
jgi:hypothetical protein